MKTGKNRKDGMVNEQASQILVDIVVANCQISARKVSSHVPEMPNDDVGIIKAIKGRIYLTYMKYNGENS